MVGEGRERLNFFRKTIFRLARSWAKIPGLTWTHVESSLFRQCPKFDNQDENWNLGEDGQHSILALGTYFLESGGQHADKIVPYLLNIESNLHRIKILDKKSMTHSKSSFLILGEF
jgi:phosphatidylinositol 4-kinase